ncbi:amino acid ABC transporter ATP-binding protein, partial [Vibrio parahaemolyticus]|nr:amino acid ABC transporter ATP-binding protein [Vibrio parahaemolyticus]
KSTFLRTINQLETINSGSIIVDGIDMYHKSTDINKLRADVGMVFQGFNLFPHKTAIENVMLAPLKVSKRDPESVKKEAKDWLYKVGLS